MMNPDFMELVQSNRLGKYSCAMGGAQFQVVLKAVLKLLFKEKPVRCFVCRLLLIQ